MQKQSNWNGKKKPGRLFNFYGSAEVSDEKGTL